MGILSILLKLTNWLIEFWSTRNEQMSDELKIALNMREHLVDRVRDLKSQTDYLEKQIKDKLTYQINLEIDLQKVKNEITSIQNERINAVKERNKLIMEQTDEEVLREEV